MEEFRPKSNDFINNLYDLKPEVGQEEISREIEVLIKNDQTGQMEKIRQRYGEEYGNPDSIVLDQMKAWKEIEVRVNNSEHKDEIKKIVDWYYNQIQPPTTILKELIGNKTDKEFIEFYDRNMNKLKEVKKIADKIEEIRADVEEGYISKKDGVELLNIQNENLNNIDNNLD